MIRLALASAFKPTGDDNMAAITGSCRCGKVRFESTAEPIFTGVCHCRNCQKASGSAFNAVVAVPEASLVLSGTLKHFDGMGDSGQATHRGFCPECGTSITMTADVMPGVVMVPVGTLDDTSWVKPTMQLYCEAAQPWVSLGGDLRSFQKMPA
ncbi:MAG: hypothetical protein B7Z80_20700 [Rhodospirillales bacterium 20-64-7]|nr:MAG: hypothetical protein B7Z80_20700 [Rhodospirillales bacterium 20-64-7]